MAYGQPSLASPRALATPAGRLAGQNAMTCMMYTCVHVYIPIGPVYVCMYVCTGKGNM